MKKLFIYFFILLASYAYSSGFNLKSSFLDLADGSYLVMQNKDLYTLFHVQKKDNKQTHFQEISIPKDTFLSQKTSWLNWLENGAKKHSGYLRYTMDKETALINNVYLVDDEKWISPESFNQFLPTLMHLNFQRVPSEKRKRVGRAPDGFRQDTRPYWSPKVIFNGDLIKDVRFEEWESRWPDDQSDFSGISIKLFFPEDGQIPFQIPFWISFQDSAFYQIIRTVDAGVFIENEKQVTQ